MKGVARAKGRPNLSEAAEIDRAIRDAALRMLLEHGEAATMQAIAATAGISRKSLYARYPNKEQLFLEVIRELLKAVGHLDYDATGTAEERLRHYVQAALDAISRPQSRAIQRLLAMDPIYIAALRPEMLAATQTIFFEPLAELLRSAQDKGELIVEDVHWTVRVIIRLIFTESIEPGQSVPQTQSRQDYPEFITRLLVRGLLPREEGGSRPRSATSPASR